MHALTSAHWNAEIPPLSSHGHGPYKARTKGRRAFPRGLRDSCLRQEGHFLARASLGVAKKFRWHCGGCSQTDQGWSLAGAIDHRPWYPHLYNGDNNLGIHCSKPAVLCAVLAQSECSQKWSITINHNKIQKWLGFPQWLSSKEFCLPRQEMWVRAPGWEDPLQFLFQGTPLQYSCQENPTDKGAWKVVVHGVAESQTQLRDWASTHT